VKINKDIFTGPQKSLEETADCRLYRNSCTLEMMHKLVRKNIEYFSFVTCIYIYPEIVISITDFDRQLFNRRILRYIKRLNGRLKVYSF